MSRFTKNLDPLIFVAVMSLSIFGIIAIASADHINAIGVSRLNFYKQIIFLFTGLVLMLISSTLDLNFLSNFYAFIYIFDILLLVAVLLFGIQFNQARRWISFKLFTIQPSEFSKLFIIFFNAKLIHKHSDTINHFVFLLFIVVLNAIPIYLVMKQPSLSASLVLIFILAFQLFCSGIDYRYVFAALIGATILLAFIFYDATLDHHLFIDKILKPYQIDRIVSTLHPEKYLDNKAYQTLKSIQAIGSGRLSGKGLFNGTLNQLSYLPEPNNDFIFSVIGEEFGFYGCMFVVLTECFIIARSLIAARDTQERFYSVLLSGIAGMLFFQSFVHMGVTSGILPNTGMGLPFVSSGGSALWTHLIAIGLVMNVTSKNRKPF